MKVSVFGTWYVWLVTAICMAKIGHDVVWVDIDAKKIENIKQWIMPIYEPWLAELYDEVKSKIHFTTDAKIGIEHGDVIFNAVGTPWNLDGSANLTYVYTVAETFATYLNHDAILVNKSTVPVWTAQECLKRIATILEMRDMNYSYDVVSNPEFLKEWTAIDDFMQTERIVCGYSKESSKKNIQELYKYFIDQNIPIVYTDTASSELIKYAANSFLATKISFINELANFAEIVWADITDIARGMWLDSRIGTKFLNAWTWYGWSCFPKDVQALIHTGREHGYEFKIPLATEAVNEIQKSKALQFLKNTFDSLEGKRITIWWVSFKPWTDDTRASSTRVVIDWLLQAWATVSVCDPEWVTEYWLVDYPISDSIHYPKSVSDSLEWSDALLLMTSRDEYKYADIVTLELMNTKRVFDARNMRASREMPEDIDYTGIGVR